MVGDGVDEKYFLVLNSNQYSTLVEAENANLPSMPSYFNDGVVPLASIYVQSGSANITQIQDIRPIIGFRAAGVNASSVHGNLLGLNADDHTQYLLVNGNRAMAGTLSLGGNDITNVGTMFGTASWANNAVTASAATSITFIPATASFATSASFAPTILPAGTVSSSLQINTGSFSGSFTGNLTGTSSVAVIAQTASYFDGFITFPSGLDITGSLVVTGSQTIIGNQSITGSLILSSSLPLELQVVGDTEITGSLRLTSGGITGSLFGTASWANSASVAISSSFATTASFASNVIKTKAGSVTNSSFTGNPRKTTVTFATAFPNTNYAVTVTGEDSRAWSIESKLAGSFVISANSNTNLIGNTYWIATAYGEN